MNLILFEKINSIAFRWDLLDQILVFNSIYLPYILLFCVFLYFKRYKFLPILSILSGFISCFFVLVFRFVYYNPRPFVDSSSEFLLNHSDISSFPSAHTSFFFAFSTIVFLYNKKIGSLFYFLSLIIGLSRVATGLHWPIDIFGGIVLGILVGWATWFFMNKHFRVV